MTSIPVKIVITPEMEQAWKAYFEDDAGHHSFATFPEAEEMKRAFCYGFYTARTPIVPPEPTLFERMRNRKFWQHD